VGARTRAEAQLRAEVGWAAHTSLPVVLLPPPSLDSVNYGMVVNHLMANLEYTRCEVRIPIEHPSVAAAAAEARVRAGQVGSDESESVWGLREERHRLLRRKENDPWEAWTLFSNLCSSSGRSLGVCLEVGDALPPDEELDRWVAGEPVYTVSLSTSAFQEDAEGYPSLPERLRTFLTRLFEFSVRIVISDASDDLGTHMLDRRQLAGAAQLGPYVAYVASLYGQLPPLTENQAAEVSYRDYLQAPLQPLMDHLDHQTYETFEKDETKYVLYEEAIYRCLLDRVPEADVARVSVLVMVVGAGRGPLIRRALAAAERARRTIRVVAVEKNPHAVTTLRKLRRTLGWGDRVRIVAGDMRQAETSEKADIIVSELLGSFGDNELSPECLDGAQRFLKPDGVSIPQSYVSYLQPICSARLHESVRALDGLKHWETGYVVKLHAVRPLSRALPVFSFAHPNRDAKIDNSRFWQGEFPIAQASTCHGFAGYFDATLYGDVHCSIYPETHSTHHLTGEDMFSWFPIYWPLMDPVYVAKGDVMRAAMARRVSSSKVWYEWACTAPTPSHVHNVAGRSYWIGL